MVCSISCSISFIFIVGMIYFYNATAKNKTVIQYRSKLTPRQREIYDKIAKERFNISMQGYMLGAFLSLFVIYYNYRKKGFKPASVMCLVLATSFITNYFYYKLTPKSDWMLHHVETQEQTQDWLNMYKTMQYYYHAGLALGIVGLCVLAYAFRC